MIAPVILVLVCGLPLAGVWFSGRNETRAADEAVGRYLRLVHENDHAGATGMLCGGDDTSTADLPGMEAGDGRASHVESFTILKAWDWSSVIDGHGRGYRVRLIFGDGTAATVELVVEVIDRAPCIGTEIPI